MKNSILIFATIALAILFGCNQTKLTNDEAKVLIIKTLNLPVTYRHDINKRPSMGSGFELDGLRSAGLIAGSEYLDVNRPIEIQITETGQSSFMGENNNAYMFKTNDIDFDQITGISINKEEQTATVRFSLIAKNATIAAYALAKTDRGFSGKKYINYSLINPLNGELAFKKFDNGWQLLEQGKSSSDLLNQILDSDANSNRQDDYSKQINDKLSVINAEVNESNEISEKGNKLWNSISTQGKNIKGKCSNLSYVSENNWVMITESKFMKEIGEEAIQIWIFRSDTLCFYKTGKIAGAMGNEFSTLHYYLKNNIICKDYSAGSVTDIKCDNVLAQKYLKDSNEIYQLFKSGKIVDGVIFNCN